MHKALRLLQSAAPVAALLLSACGGGGGGVNFVPAPTSTPASYSSFPLTGTATFEAITSSRHVVVDPKTAGAVTLYSNYTHGRSSDFTISYDSTTGSYTVTGLAGTATFAATDRSSTDYLDTYSTQSPQTANTLVLFNNVRSGASQASAPIKLTYMSYGYWSRRDNTGDINDSYFLFGYPTLTSDVPRSGTATYSTAVTASAFNPQTGGAIPISGSATFSADFANATVDTMLTLPLDFQSQSPTPFNYHGTGTISGNEFAGTFQSSDDPDLYLGNFTGGFFGPSAQEMGYTFALDRRHLDTVLSWTIGAVVGTKSAN